MNAGMASLSCSLTLIEVGLGKSVGGRLGAVVVSENKKISRALAYGRGNKLTKKMNASRRELYVIVNRVNTTKLTGCSRP